MVWFPIYTEWGVSEFGVSHIFPIAQVEGNIKEVYGVVVSLDCNFQAIATGNAAQIFFDEPLFAMVMLWRSRGCHHGTSQNRMCYQTCL